MVYVGMFNGGRSKKSLENLLTLMLQKSIYVPETLRVLRIINGRVCEFCIKNRCYFLRPQFGIFACWPCLHKGERMGNYDEQSNALSSRWHKVLYQPKRGFYIKQYYLAHRLICFCIFEYIRILAYPTGVRWLVKTGSDYQTTVVRNLDGNTTSKDAHEIMWSRLTYDSCNNLVGPYFCKSDVSRLVDYIKHSDIQVITPHSVQPLIKQFLRHHIKLCPRSSTYQPFIDAFNRVRDMACHRQLLQQAYVSLVILVYFRLLCLTLSIDNNTVPCCFPGFQP